MKPLFNEYLALNEEGGEIAQKTWEFLRNLLDQHPGVNPRDLGEVVSNTVSGFTAEQLLRYAMTKRKLERMQKEQADVKLP